jgi:hypothetical protein
MLRSALLCCAELCRVRYVARCFVAFRSVELSSVEPVRLSSSRVRSVGLCLAWLGYVGSDELCFAVLKLGCVVLRSVLLSSAGCAMVC